MKIGKVLGVMLDDDTRIVGYVNVKEQMVLELQSMKTRKREVISRGETLEILEYLGVEE